MRYLQEWAGQYGFMAGQVKAAVDRWAAEGTEQADSYELALKAFAGRKFARRTNRHWTLPSKPRQNWPRRKEASRKPPIVPSKDTYWRGDAA